MPENHVQPTKEDLDRQIQADLEEIEKDPPTEESLRKEKEAAAQANPAPDPKILDDLPPLDEEVVEEEQLEEAETKTVVPTEKKESTKEPTEEEKLKKKFSESSREAQVIAFSKAELERQIDEAQEMAEPTEAQLQAEFADWDTFTELEKRLATDNLHQRQITGKIKEVRNAQKEAQGKITQRLEQIDVFAIDPEVLAKFPKLEGRQEEFKVFATKNTRLAFDLEDAAGLFSISVPEPIKHKGKMFETSSAGPNENPKPKSTKISIEQSELLMNTDFKKYKEYLRRGLIEQEV